MLTYFISPDWHDFPEHLEIWIAERKDFETYHALVQDLDRSYGEGELYEIDIMIGDPECLLTEECLMIG